MTRGHPSAISGSFVDATGGALGEPFAVAQPDAPVLGADVEIGTGATYSEMPPAIAWSETSSTLAAVFHGTSDEDFAVAFTADGMQSAVVEATSSRGREGHFNPHVVAHATRPEWLLVTSLGFATVVGQRLGP